MNLTFYLLYYSQLQFHLIKECQKKIKENKTTTDSTQVVWKRLLKPQNTLMVLTMPRRLLILPSKKSLLDNWNSRKAKCKFFVFIYPF